MGEPTITIRQALLGIAIITVAIAFATAGTRSMRINRNERRIGRLMLSAGQHMTLFRDASYRDADGDGRGEFAGLEEVGGVLAIPDRVIAGQTRQSMHTDLMNQLARAAASGDGIAELHGYRIALWLPLDEGWELQRRPDVLTELMRGTIAPLTPTQAPLSAGAPGTVIIPLQVAPASTAADAEQADGRERRYTLIAWPISWMETGKHTFVLTETGFLMRSRESGLAEGVDRPDPERCRRLAGGLPEDPPGSGTSWIPVARVPGLR